MFHFPNRIRPGSLLAWLMVVAAVAAPSAAARHSDSGDVVSRYLVAHGIVIGRSAAPVSDVADSLEVKRTASATSGASDTPVSDVESSLQATRRLRAGSGDERGQGYRFITDTLAPGGGTNSVPVAAEPGFSWGDAGIGAAGAAGIVLALLGAMRLMVSRRRAFAA